ncbi:unnamed protein product, partial [Rhizoctonia solani]
MASSSGRRSKTKKGLRKLLSDTLRARSRSKSPSQLSGQAQPPDLHLATSSNQPDPQTLGISDTSKTRERTDEQDLKDASAREAAPHEVSPPNTVWIGLGESLRSLRDESGALSSFVIAIEGLVSCLDRSEIIARDRPDYDNLATSLTTSSNALLRTIWDLGPNPTHNAVLGIIFIIRNQVTKLRSRLLPETELDGPSTRLAEEDLGVCFTRIQMLFGKLEANLRAEGWSAAEETMISTLLESLSPARRSTHDSGSPTDVRRTCTEGTRAGVLANLDAWLNDSTTSSLCRMSGAAGTGKTTIARTFC